MAYTKKLWGSGDYLTTEELNRMEDGIANYNGTVNGVKICSGRTSFPAGHTQGVVQQVTVNLPTGFYTEIPNVVPVWSARGSGGLVSLTNAPYVVDTTLTAVTFGWLGDGVSQAAHYFDWIAAGI